MKVEPSLARHNELPVALTARMDYFLGLNVCRVQLTLHNWRAAEHPGGLWDLGNGGSVYLTAAELKLKASGTIQYSLDPDAPFETVPGSSCFVNQYSSGGVNWSSSNHLDRHRKIPMKQSGIECFPVREENLSEKRAVPILQRGSRAICLPEFWQNFPKFIEARPEGLSLDLFPAVPETANEIQGGEQKTHTFYIAFDIDKITSHPLEWAREPLLPTLDPNYVESTQAIKYLTAKSTDSQSTYLKLVDQAIEGEDTFFRKREIIDEYGWRHFGDIYGDHEAVFHEGPTPLVSHYNNQYDPVAGFAYQFLRGGDRRWFSQMTELAQHVIDIDIYNTDEDKAAYNHGLFWHTYHYVDADTGTHRTYPKRGRIPPKGIPVPGGGPANEQNYAHGLMLTYFLTGNKLAWDAAIGLAQWVIDMDDGGKTIFRWLTRHHTGLASSSRDPSYHGPGRGAANSISVLCDGFRLTQNRKFLNKAEELIRRVIHPSDDPTRILTLKHNGRVLVDAENRWFYTMFLQALGKYLDLKVERNEFDSAYAYGRTCLLNYSRWMLEIEAPYLSNPEILEYPTETWVAQDMRKSEIFLYAAEHAEASERPLFLEKARYFFDYSVNTLDGMKTKSLCRPVVLLLSFGWMYNWFQKHPETVLPGPKESKTNFGQPTVFVPQKVIAKQRAKQLVAAGGLLVMAGIIYLVLKR
jgi:hypothetical protein